MRVLLLERQVRFLLFLVVIFSVGVHVTISAQEQEPTPANPDSSPEVRSILDYLHRLPSESENRVLLGQFGGYGEGQTYEQSYQQVQEVYQRTGRWPAVTGADCAMPGGMGEAGRYISDMWEQGFWVNLSCHFANPWTGGRSFDALDESTSDPWDRRSVRDLVTPGTAGNAAWLSMLDDVAGGLQTLQDAGVVVFWRPLHEMNGDWFWWGGQAPEDFIALWRSMFTYFTETKGLHNLIWVYSPNAHFEDVGSTYPGNDYVDVVSLDVYMSVDEDTLNINSAGEYDALVSTGKPVALFEFGPIPASGAGWNTTTYDWTNLIRDIREHYPNIVLVQAWEYVWQLGYNRYHGLSDLVEDPWIITREELLDDLSAQEPQSGR
jgi:mannan endo-1,4-beta-mannosidase